MVRQGLCRVAFTSGIGRVEYRFCLFVVISVNLIVSTGLICDTEVSVIGMTMLPTIG